MPKAPSQYAEREIQMQRALAEARSSTTLSLPKIASKHDVTVWSLRDRLAGKGARIGCPGACRLLTNASEHALPEYIKRNNALGVSATMKMIGNAAWWLANDQLPQAERPHRQIGKHWLKRFVKAHPEVFKVRPRVIELHRASEHDPRKLENWFKRLKEVIDGKGIQTCDMWNMDEVGFCIGVGGAQWCLTLNPTSCSEVSSNTRRESCTLIEAISAAGNYIDSFAIMEGVQIKANWFDNNLPAHSKITVSDTGYTDDLIALGWLQHFDKQTRLKQKGRYRLLLLDGHTSHCTYQFIDYCNKHNIIPFLLIPHTTHLMQPLDLTVFGPFKHWHKESVDWAARMGCDKFDKTEFLSVLQDVRTKTFKSGTIRAGWRKSGIVPYNPTIVTSTLHDIGVDRVGFKSNDTPAAPTIDRAITPPVNLTQTPKTSRTLSRFATALSARKEAPPSPTTMRLQRGIERVGQDARLQYQQLVSTTSVIAAKRARQANKRIAAPQGGLMVVSTACLIDEHKMLAYNLKQDQLEEKRQEAEREVWLIEIGWKKFYPELKKAIRAIAKLRPGRMGGWDRKGNVIDYAHPKFRGVRPYI